MDTATLEAALQDLQAKLAGQQQLKAKMEHVNDQLERSGYLLPRALLDGPQALAESIAATEWYIQSLALLVEK